MKLHLTISLLLLSFLGFSQKITLTVKKDTLEEFETITIDEKYNGFYATKHEQVVINAEGQFITVKAKCFMLVKNDSCWVIQKNISNKLAYKKFKKNMLFNPKKVLQGRFKSGVDVKKTVYYLNLSDLNLGKFYRSTSIKKSDNYPAFFVSHTIRHFPILKKTESIQMPVIVVAVGAGFQPNGIYTSIYYTFVKID